MASYYEHNYDAFGDQVLRAEFMQNVMRARAVAVMAEAMAIAPVGDPDNGWYDDGHEPGEYLDSFEVSSGVRATGSTSRAYGRVTNTSGHALAVEYGYGKVPRYRVLGKSLHVAG